MRTLCREDLPHFCSIDLQIHLCVTRPPYLHFQQNISFQWLREICLFDRYLQLNIRYIYIYYQIIKQRQNISYDQDGAKLEAI